MCLLDSDRLVLSNPALSHHFEFKRNLPVVRSGGKIAVLVRTKHPRGDPSHYCCYLHLPHSTFASVTLFS
jgi:hypothetical protein